MKFGFSGEYFGNLLVFLTIFSISLVGIIFIIAHKRGIDVTRRSFQLKVGIGGAIIFVIIPLLLSDLTVRWKIFSSILSLAAGIGNYFAIDRMQSLLRNQLGDKNKKKL